MNKYLPKVIGFFVNLIGYLFPKYAAHIAYTIFATPRKGKLKNGELPLLNTAIKKTIPYNNIPLMTYHWKGDKETVLLVHGWESNSYRWKNLINLLIEENYNIVAIDAPAHGASGNKTFNAPLYSKCIHTIAKQFESKIIIGHSVGGTASLIAANNNLPQVKKIVSLGAPSNFKAMINFYINLMGYNKRVIKALNTYFLKHFGFLPEHLTVSKFSENITADTLVIHDKKDKTIPFIDALHINKHIKNVTLIKTKGLGHGLKSEKVYNAILAFLNH